MQKVIIYTDGSSRGNPGPGGWGAIILSRDTALEIGGREEQTTNNRMEIMAAIEAVKLINESVSESRKTGFSGDIEMEIYSDSEYVIKGITIWINNWQKNNWKTKDKREVMNKDLWQRLLSETANAKIEWKKVLGHSGHELNDRCDEIATGFADGLNVELYDGSKENYKFHTD